MQILIINIVSETTYCVVLSPRGNIVDVIAELNGGDYAKCTRTTKTTDIVDDEIGVGFLCGSEFFEPRHLRRTAG